MITGLESASMGSATWVVNGVGSADSWRSPYLLGQSRLYRVRVLLSRLSLLFQHRTQRDKRPGRRWKYLRIPEFLCGSDHWWGVDDITVSWTFQTLGNDIEVVQDAVDLTGMIDVPWDHRTELLSDNGPGYISHSFGEHLRLVGIRHILASPLHPQTNGKLERYHRTIKLDVNQIPYDVPGNLEAAITEFVNYYNNRRCQKALGNVTPSDVLDGCKEEILER